MSTTPPTYYDVMGLSQSATQEEIKRRYRELARRHHPDVAASPDSASRFREINEANRVLSDPARRANYDAELKLNARLQSAPPRAGATAAPSRPAPPPSDRHDTRGAAAPRPGPTPPRPGDAAAARRSAEVQELLQEARRALGRARFREVNDLCRQALRLDRSNTGAYEILGDAHQRRGHHDEAIAMYSVAVQLDRSNRSAQAKLDRLTGVPSGATMAGSAARASRARSAQTERSDPDARTRHVLSGAAAGLIGFMLYVIGNMRQPLAHSPWIFEWDPLLPLALAVSGLAAGFIGARNGWLASASEVLGPGPNRGRRNLRVPLGAVLAAFSLVLLHASAVLYLIVASIQGRISRSILAAYLVTYGLVTLFALAAHAAGGYVVLFGGNLVFALFLTGWVVGERLRI